jgi:hypothetical protein
MAKSTSLFLPKGANNQSVTILPADTTVAKLVFTAGADDSDVKAIVATSNDTAAVNLAVYVTRSAVDYLLGTVNVPLGAGTDGTKPSVDVLAALGIPGLPLDDALKPYLPLKTGDTLKIGALVTITAAKTVWISVFGQDY